MFRIICISHVPDNVLIKAESIVSSDNFFNAKWIGWKNISSLPGYFSCKLTNKYRLLFSKSGLIFVGNHDAYENKIKKLKK